MKYVINSDITIKNPKEKCFLNWQSKMVNITDNLIILPLISRKKTILTTDLDPFLPTR